DETVTTADMHVSCSCLGDSLIAQASLTTPVVGEESIAYGDDVGYPSHTNTRAFLEDTVGPQVSERAMLIDSTKCSGRSRNYYRCPNITVRYKKVIKRPVMQVYVAKNATMSSFQSTVHTAQNLSDGAGEQDTGMSQLDGTMSVVRQSDLGTTCSNVLGLSTSCSFTTNTLGTNSSVVVGHSCREIEEPFGQLNIKKTADSFDSPFTQRLANRHSPMFDGNYVRKDEEAITQLFAAALKENRKGLSLQDQRDEKILAPGFTCRNEGIQWRVSVAQQKRPRRRPHALYCNYESMQIMSMPLQLRARSNNSGTGCFASDPFQWCGQCATRRVSKGLDDDYHMDFEALEQLSISTTSSCVFGVGLVGLQYAGCGRSGDGHVSCINSCPSYLQYEQDKDRRSEKDHLAQEHSFRSGGTEHGKCVPQHGVSVHDSDTANCVPGSPRTFTAVGLPPIGYEIERKIYQKKLNNKQLNVALLSKHVESFRESPSPTSYPSKCVKLKCAKEYASCTFPNSGCSQCADGSGSELNSPISPSEVKRRSYFINAMQRKYEEVEQWLGKICPPFSGPRQPHG
ncbi:hypothetical protein, conserved (fragment), partial [Trypanosoma vivax Y486]